MKRASLFFILLSIATLISVEKNSTNRRCGSYFCKEGEVCCVSSHSHNGEQVHPFCAKKCPWYSVDTHRIKQKTK